MSEREALDRRRTDACQQTMVDAGGYIFNVILSVADSSLMVLYRDAVIYLSAKYAPAYRAHYCSGISRSAFVVGYIYPDIRCLRAYLFRRPLPAGLVRPLGVSLVHRISGYELSAGYSSDDCAPCAASWTSRRLHCRAAFCGSARGRRSVPLLEAMGK